MLTNEILRRFEYALAFHCAPALAGIKSADLISWTGAPEEGAALVERFARELAGAGISVELLCRCERHGLILVYRRGLLERQLERQEVRYMLRRDGYPVDKGLEAMLGCLSRRLRECREFPHEVGLFLGYPAEDVEGFRDHGGRDYKCCGLWKVYSDVERAQTCFRRYGCCRRALCRRLEQGRSLGEVFRAA